MWNGVKTVKYKSAKGYMAALDRLGKRVFASGKYSNPYLEFTYWVMYPN